LIPRALWVSVISQSLLIRGSRHCANQSRALELRSSGVNSATTTLVSRSIIERTASPAFAGAAFLHHRGGEGHGGLKLTQISGQS
jgi:hypothetical protein